MKYLTPEEILIIHFEIIEQTGGAHGVRDVGLLKSAAERPKSFFDGKELYKGIFQKAAALLESLTQYHVFVDGNKRTAFAATAHFLYLNGYEVEVKNKTVVKFMLKVATEKPGLEAIAAWLKQNSQQRN